jgi:hypothetical protein
VTLAWGQPVGSLVQFAYVVEDIEREMQSWIARLSVGPWFVRGPFEPKDARHRGRPTKPLVTVARAFSGHAMVELIEQHDDGQSVFHEGGGPRRYGFHHWATMSSSFDEDLARYAAMGYEEAFFDTLPTGSRVVYVDATRDLPGMLEIVEYTDAQERVYATIYAAARDWDGADPIREG